MGTTSDGASAASAAFLLAGARLVADAGTNPDDVRGEVAALLMVLDELVAAHVDSRRAEAEKTGSAPADDAALRRLSGGWHVLGRHRWPSSHRRDLELLLVGPAGVLVVVGIGWANLRVAGGHLWRGGECADVVLDSISADADAVRRLLAEAGLAPGEVTPVVLATGADQVPCFVRGVGVVGLSRLPSVLVRRGARLEPPSVRAVIAALARTIPAPRPAADRAAGGRGTDSPRTAEGPDPLPAMGLTALAPLTATENDRVMRALEDVLEAAPAPPWATWLHPEQSRAAVRPLPGPALLTGAAGTGKTVVALQRLRPHAGTGRRMLLTSPVPGVAEADRTTARRMTPHGWDGVDFVGLPGVARRVLLEAGDDRVAGIDLQAPDRCWAQAWDDVRAGRDDAEVGLPGWPGEAFWREEVGEVLGRGLEEEQTFREWCRTRPVALPARVQAGVWALASRYRRRLRERAAFDAQELYLAALARLSLPRRPLWDGVTVDDAQELSWAGLHLVQALGGERDEGLLLVSDPEQTCRREPATLGEAGIDLEDRVVSLRHDHRCAELVQEAAAEFRESATARRPVASAHPQRAGGQVVYEPVSSAAQERARLIAAVQEARSRAGVRPDQAVLVEESQVPRWCAALAAAGVVATPLVPGTGATRDGGVRVGSPEQARGLEFGQVFLPTMPGWGAPETSVPGGEALAESLRVQTRRRLHAAATRARDLLWVADRD